MALIDPDAVVLLHPFSRELNVYTAQLWNRGENAGDIAQQSAITQAFTDAIAARDGSLTIQRADFAADPDGHLGRHLKAQLSEIVYRALSNADISTDLDSIAVGAGVGGGSYDNTFTPLQFFGTFYGFEVGAGHTTSIDPRTFAWSGTNVVISLYAQNTSSYTFGMDAGAYTGRTFEFVLEGFNDFGTPLAMTGAGTQLQFDAGIPAGFYTYLQAQVGNALGLSVVETT
ncbi:MAG: hypothetical protein GY799_18890 [Desulfobulbaceae bacterium]|nr:hypothetical protein [Desulfobulbaceae bacterium]